jgi:hypothetical protein
LIIAVHDANTLTTAAEQAAFLFFSTLHAAGASLK